MSAVVEGSTCPVCGVDLGAAATRVCERCDTPHHLECWEYAGGCAIYGCRSDVAPAVRSEALPGLLRWLWFCRTYAEAQSVLSLSMLFGCVVAYVLLGVLMIQALFPISEAQFTLAVQVVVVLGIGAVGAAFSSSVVMALTIIPALLVRRSAMRVLDVGPEPPRCGSVAVSERLDLSASFGMVGRVTMAMTPMASALWRPLAVLIVAGFIPYVWNPPIVGPLASIVGLSMLTVYWFFTVARDRMLWCESLQARALRSLKESESCGGLS